MVSILVLIAGCGLMGFGFFMLYAWVGGRGGWFDTGVFDRSGASKNDRQFIDLYYVAIVLAPLLIGAILLAYGLRKWL